MSGVRRAYDGLVASGQLRADPAQADVADRLETLANMLEHPPEQPGLLARLFGARPEPRPRGIYLWGGVGRGKSMLMDLFFSHVSVPPARRVHFHAFMLETHARIAEERGRGTGDPIPAVAARWAAEARLLAFDEMQVTNVADAMILSRLFAALFEADVTVVATSNRPPADLYRDGLNREHFLPFIAMLEDRLDVIALDGPVDYRRDRIGGTQRYYTPNGPAATEALANLFFRLTDFPVEDRANVPTMALDVGGGRILHVPKALKGVAVFSFKRLCADARGAADYLAVARTFHSVFLVGVPVMGPENRNEAARFVTLIDALYEWGCKLFIAADAPPEQLYRAGDGRFEFDRTVSRLLEMQADSWLERGHGLSA